MFLDLVWGWHNTGICGFPVILGFSGLLRLDVGCIWFVHWFSFSALDFLVSCTFRGFLISCVSWDLDIPVFSCAFLVFLGFSWVFWFS